MTKNVYVTKVAVLACALGLAGVVPAGAADTATESLVSVGSPVDATSRNHQNEPALAIDAHDPDLLVAGANDKVDQQPCPASFVAETAKCEPDNGVGISGVYFSFDRGHTWVQPTYTGLTARDCAGPDPCAPHVGAISRIPWYYESGLVDAGDPAVAIGPRPLHGHFSWAFGSRVYYANNTASLRDFYDKTTPDLPGSVSIKGYQATGVSRIDNPTRERIADQSNWMPPVVVDPRQAQTTADDKDQIWADNAETSPYFGRVYECNNDYRSNGRGQIPSALMVSVSTDGGDTWTTQQAAAANENGHGVNEWGLGACVIRTDSKGTVYLFSGREENPALAKGAPLGQIVMQRSVDGGKSWTRPRGVLQTVNSPYVDPLSGWQVIDGWTGARTGTSGSPSVDIANGAPDGTDATDRIIVSWANTGADAANQGAMISSSTDRGENWSEPQSVALPGDRPLYSAPAISPSGDRAYVVYEAVTSPWRGSDISSPRPYHGVFMSAPITAGIGEWSAEYDGPTGDLRATFPGGRLREERVGDYLYAAASRSYGVGVWIDVRNATVCPAIQDWRAASLAAGTAVLPPPSPLTDCPPTFGNSDVFAATTG